MLLLMLFILPEAGTSGFYPLSLHDALPICPSTCSCTARIRRVCSRPSTSTSRRSEEHTSELQSLRHLVCRLLLEKKKTTVTVPPPQKFDLPPCCNVSPRRSNSHAITRHHGG